MKNYKNVKHVGKILKYQGKQTTTYCSKKCANHDHELIKKANVSRENTCLKRYGVKCNFSLESNKEKQKLTNLKRYRF